MKKFAKISAVLAAMALAFAFFGCSDGSSSGGSDDSEINGGGTSGGGSNTSGGGTSGGNERIPEGFVKVKGGTVEGKENPNDGVFIDGRTVTLSDFYMSKFEVTQDEYSEVMKGQKVTVSGTEYTLNANPSYCKEGSSVYAVYFGTEQGKRPVEGVTWYDAVYYCNARSLKEGLKPAYSITVTTVSSGGNITEATVELEKGADGYRLPTEAEWEYAARGGDPTRADWNYMFSGAATLGATSYNSPSNMGLDAVGWYCFNNESGKTGSSSVTGSASGCGTHQVGKKKTNALGIYDMSGNVSEWCWDWYGSISSSTPESGVSSGRFRVLRGGSWSRDATRCTVAYRQDCSPYYRGGDDPDGKYGNIGFRVVRSAQ